jgi:hypothetical protein
MSDPRPDVDTTWAPLAVSTRQALLLLDYDIFPDCLPGELHPCGGSFAEHAAAHLAALRAVVEHRITHLGADAQPMVEQIYTATLAGLRAGDPCDQGHQP